MSALAQLLNHRDKTEPLTIGLLGDWGSGKTTVLELLKKKLCPEDNAFTRPDVRFRVQWFNAWAYEHTDDIQAGIAQEAITGLTHECSFLKKLSIAFRLHWQTQRLSVVINVLVLIGWLVVIGILLGVGRINVIQALGVSTILGLLQGYRWLKPLLASTFAKEFLTYLNLPNYEKSLGQLPVYQKQIKALSEICLKGDQRLMFIVDDLDRCSTEGIIKVFEATRLVMELDRVVVIIAIDHRIALATLAHQYRHLADHAGNNPGEDTKGVSSSAQALGSHYRIARDYLGKIIHLPINLDQPSVDDVNRYIEKLFHGLMLEPEAAPPWQDLTLPTETSSEDGGERESEINTPEPAQGEPPNPITRKLDETGIDKLEITLEPMKHSEEEKQLFAELCQVYQLNNPRQIKRLHSSYRLILAYHKTTPDEARKLLITLFAKEVEQDTAWDSDTQKQTRKAQFKQNLNDELLFNEQLRDFLETPNQAAYINASLKITPFVLPAIDPNPTDTRVILDSQE